ncbi:large subunit ribosomal protein L15 [Saccharopolyspora lacisalsi]|uniref:Large ribosomal subunit protein uL15 n=1 Tax=Halosaccharopolyspora lacisalsi TaxID=1000566 RepID=A0A839E577_9PSEU|nr:50S ribosomal protein L15 [Halosaccharopolyspora lacisalsi]MBA8827005.1 large subunit ribosomal protein L15 [Halosaccharopolyspora lacisalsi]
MVIKIHDLQPAAGSNRDRVRVGRGEASKGKTAGRGTKGTRARKTVSPRFEGGQMPLQMRLPKLRGFKNRNRVEYQGINIGRLAQAFPEGGTVGLDELISSGLVKKGERVKVLGDGDLEGVKLDVTAHAFTGSAQEKITAAGGSATKHSR